MSERTPPISFCNACGTEVPEGARFCQNCGAELAPLVSASAPQPVAAKTPSPNPPPQLPAYDLSSPAYPPRPYPVIPQYAGAPAKSGKAVAGFWLGIVSIPCCILSWIGIIVGIIGLIFAILGLGEARRLGAAAGDSPARFGYRQALIGIVCAIIGILLSTALLIYLLNNLEKYGIKITR